MEHVIGGKFKLGRKIGSGSFGELYLGMQFSCTCTTCIVLFLKKIQCLYYVFVNCLFICFEKQITVKLILLLVWFVLGTNVQTEEEVAVKLVSKGSSSSFLYLVHNFSMFINYSSL